MDINLGDVNDEEMEIVMMLDLYSIVSPIVISIYLHFKIDIMYYVWFLLNFMVYGLLDDLWLAGYFSIFSIEFYLMLMV